VTLFLLLQRIFFSRTRRSLHGQFQLNIFLLPIHKIRIRHFADIRKTRRVIHMSESASARRLWVTCFIIG
jgi:hypothetical protein